MSKGKELTAMLNEQLDLGMDDLVIDFMAARFDKAYFDEQEDVDALGAQLYLASWDESVALSDIQALKDDPSFEDYFKTGEQPAQELTVTEDQLRAAVEEESYAIEHGGIEYTFEDSEYNIDTSQVTDMSSLFGGAWGNRTDFNGDIGYWDVSRVTDMSDMFYYAAFFDQNIGDWDVSSVEDMSWMFTSAEDFNQDLSGWLVPEIEERPEGFAVGSPLEGKEDWHPQWGGFEPKELSVALENITTSGEVGSQVEIDATVEHTGNADEVVFTITQGTGEVIDTVRLDQNEPAIEDVSWTLENSVDFDPGAVDVEISVEENGEIFSDGKTFGLYEGDEDYDWQWSDPDQPPFDMIGQTIVDHDGLADNYYGTGTGFMISPKHIMTNAHVLSDDEWESDLTELNEVDFYLGRNGGTLDEEQEENLYHGEHAYLQNEEWGDEWPDTDMAIVTMDSEVNHLGHFDWFWNARDSDRDITGESVFLSGYPSKDIDQGGGYFQWMAEGTISEYINGYEDYGEESGGLEFTQSMSAAGGASGSPIISQNEDDELQFAGVYTGHNGADPVAATLDPAAYDWALSVVQDDGYLTDLDYVDGPMYPGDMGPDKALPDTDGGLEQHSVAQAGPAGIKIQGIQEDDAEGFAMVA